MSNIRNETYIKAFGKNLAKLRTEKGLTQQELSYNSDIERTQISRIERGEVNCTISMAYILAKALEVHPSVLFIFEFSENSN
ncbi:MAG TPA: helix-turn-helix transcriptional regulator [Bacteroidia bacterium]|nr:helix-turn-helix transcriptional regulator [Bacteroidia bacterium]